MASPPEVRTGQGPEQLSRPEFASRFRGRFLDPEFAAHAGAIEELLEVAWDAYKDSRKSPRTRPAGAGFADPTYELSVDWLAAKEVGNAARALSRQLQQRRKGLQPPDADLAEPRPK
jgi:hypothetical protein